ncbi:MAG: choice-of-anchor L domain-containing protein [Bacteroidetes bacterium]|nr:choice-of-anchor L domain-containing protein [Bacteroidota bacterium]
MKRTLLLVITAFLLNHSYAQLTAASSNYTNIELFVNNIFVGTGVSISNVTFNGSYGNNWNTFGSFTTGLVQTNLGMNSGLLLATGGVSGAGGPNNSGGYTLAVSPTTPVMSDTDLLAIVDTSIFSLKDAAILEFDFIPYADTISFNYVFGSDEYPEYINSFKDAFAFFISGLNPSGGNYFKKNIALFPGTNIPVSIHNLNNGTANTGPCVNCQYYINNTGGTGIQADGFTTVLKASANVVPFTTYHLKIVIADANDQVLDSWLFLEANSFSTNAPSISVSYSNQYVKPMAIEGCNNANIKFKIPKALTNTVTIPLIISGTAINGIDYQLIPDTVYILPGQTSLNLTIVPLTDNINEPIETVIIKTNSPLFTGFADSVQINIFNREPILLNVSNDTTICQDYFAPNNLQIYVIANGGSGSLTYSWQPYYLLNSDTIPNPVATPVTTTQFNVFVTDTTGCQGSTSSVVITVNETPQISYLYEHNSGCLPFTLTIQNQTTPLNSTFIWTFGDGSTSDVRDPSHTYQNSGIYTIIVKAYTDKGCFSKYTDSSAIQVFGVKTPTIIKIGDTLIAIDNNYVFQWYKNDTIIQGAVSYFYIPAETGYYSVIAQDYTSCYSLPSNKILSPDINLLINNNNIFPNPSYDYFGFKYNLIVKQIDVFDLNGKQIKHFNYDLSNIYDISELSKGLYFIKIQYDENKMDVLKLIKY